MATNVNPTRMELTRLKRRLATAVRGHKLPKDKRDEMVRQFMIYIRRKPLAAAEMEKALQNVSIISWPGPIWGNFDHERSSAVPGPECRSSKWGARM